MRKNNILIFGLISLLILSVGLNFNIWTINSVTNEIISDSSDKILNSDSLSFYKPTQASIIGRYHNENSFYRLSSNDKSNLRNKVWDLSKNSSGIQIHFSSNSSTIAVKLILERLGKKGNMNTIGSSGVDLYIWSRGKWQFVDAGIPTSIKNVFILGKNIKKEPHKYLLNLPLYTNVENIEIGIEKDTRVSFDKNFSNKKPIVFYGTSITQGASASRPGMAYTNIISRELNQEVYNLGFSGNGKFEKSIANILCAIDSELYVIDCTPNSSPEIIKENAFNFIKILNECKPKTPILLIESIIREESYFNTADKNTFGGLKYIKRQNSELRKVFEKTKVVGLQNTFYLDSEKLIGFDHEGTVDGTHLTDLGMYRIAKEIKNKIKSISHK